MFSQLVGELRAGLTRMKHRPFLEAALATAALVAEADGEVKLSERSRLDEILESLDVLKMYDVHDAVDLFNEYLKDLAVEREKAQENLLKVIGEVADNPEEADLIVRVGLAIGAADGVVDPSEHETIARICKVLGLKPAQYAAPEASDG